MRIVKQTIVTIDEKEHLQEAARILDTYCSQCESCSDCYFRALCKDSNYDLPLTLEKFVNEEIELEY
jgi:hypothetical protein